MIVLLLYKLAMGGHSPDEGCSWQAIPDGNKMEIEL
jgi:hypothetical protein